MVTEIEGDLRTQLREAALNLFREHGYERTTAAEIAARAGVTERTFFRYFPDKREVLFDGEARVRTALTTFIAEAPAELGSLDTLIYAFREFEPMLSENRPYSKPRQEIISVTPALYERELAKLDALADALADALKKRGIADLRAILAARTGMAAFTHATLAWLDDPVMSFGERIDLIGLELKAIWAEGNEAKVLD